MAPSNHSILILPLIALFPTYDPSFESFHATYAPILLAALSSLATELDASPHVHHLEIALCVNAPPTTQPPPSSSSDPPPLSYIQRYLSHTYALLALLASSPSQPPYSAHSRIEAHVILFKPGPSFPSTLHLPHALGPLTSLKHIASAPTTWTQILSLDSPRGRRDRDDWLRAYNQAHGSAASADAKVVVIEEPTGTAERQNRPLTVLRKVLGEGRGSASVALGGTFDHLHGGHKLLLSVALVALQLCTLEPGTVRHLRVGVTAEELLGRKEYSELLESWDVRAENILAFLLGIVKHDGTVTHTKSESEGRKSIRFGDVLAIDCVRITDPFGPTVTDASISTLVVSRETLKGGEAINTERQALGWEALELVVVDVLEPSGEVDAGDFASKLSSTAIRRAIAEGRAGERQSANGEVDASSGMEDLRLD